MFLSRSRGARTVRWRGIPGQTTTILDGSPNRTLPGDMFSPQMIRLWFALRRRSWASLALVPAQADESALVLGRMLCEVGSVETDAPVELLDATDVVLRNLPEQIARIRKHVARGGRVIAVLSPVCDQPVALPLTAAVDGCLLCVALGTGELAAARRTIDLVGRHRFLGCVTVRRPPPRVARAVKRAERAFLGGSHGAGSAG